MGNEDQASGVSCGNNCGQVNFDKHITISAGGADAFTLVELLVAISIVSLLMAILVPALVNSRAQSKRIFCQSNIRQLVLANVSYSGDNDGCYAPAALDIYTDNKHRWYGLRNDVNDSFNSARGPLSSYLARSGVKCSVKVNYADVSPSEPEYDQGSGGYGYNMIYIGSRIWAQGYEDTSCKVTAKNTAVRRPTHTLMFADTAMTKLGSYTAYSFAEPRYFVVNGEPVTNSGWNPSPSIHFRHRGQGNVGWVDGHVSSKKMGKYDGRNDDGVKPADMYLGWFEPMDNSLFDLK